MIGLLEAFIFFGFVVMSVIFHEAGHYIYFFVKLNGRPNIHLKKKKPFGYSIFVGESKDYNGISDKNYMQLCAWGVCSGLIIVLFYAFVNTDLFIIMLLMYVWGCIKDVKNILDYYKEERRR